MFFARRQQDLDELQQLDKGFKINEDQEPVGFRLYQLKSWGQISFVTGLLDITHDYINFKG